MCIRGQYFVGGKSYMEIERTNWQILFWTTLELTSGSGSCQFERSPEPSVVENQPPQKKPGPVPGPACPAIFTIQISILSGKDSLTAHKYLQMLLQA